MAATNQNAGRSAHAKCNSESSDDPLRHDEDRSHPISLFQLVAAMANRLASQPLSSHEIESVMGFGEVRLSM